MSEENKQIIEINGVKLEVDLRYAKKIEHYKVGDAVKLLVKEYNGYKAAPGLIVGFDNFPSKPTMVIAWLDVSYSDAALKFLYFTSETKDVEICPANPEDLIVDKAEILAKLDREETKVAEQLAEIRRKREYFLTRFGQFFQESK